jgi:hypothetical protein
MTVPFTRARTWRACGSGTSSAVTSAGPSGQKVSRLFPRVQNWTSRALTSFATV